MARKIHSDFTRGMKESWVSIALLQQRWPTAFPQDPRQVRPLAGTIIATLTAELGWSLPYTKGVLLVWKQRVAYCNAVLRYDDRLDLDGAPSGQGVSEQARADARGTLAALAERRKRRAEKDAAEAAQSIATTAVSEPASPVTVEASPIAAPAAQPDDSRRRSRPTLTLTSMRGSL